MSKRVSKEPAVIVRDGKPVAVILPIKEYEELLERLEDADDIAYLKKLRSKPSGSIPPRRNRKGDSATRQYAVEQGIATEVALTKRK